MLANLHSKKVSLCPEKDSVQILKAEQPLPKVDIFFPFSKRKKISSPSVKLPWEV